MQVDNKDIGIAAFIVTQAGVIFGFGRAYGRLSGKIESHDQQLKTLSATVTELDDGVDTRIENQIDKAMERLDIKIDGIEEQVNKAVKRFSIEIKTVEAQFVTTNGEPRFISYKAHDKIQANCQHHLLAEMGHIRASVDKTEEQLSGMREEMQTVLRELAVLLADRENKE